MIQSRANRYARPVAICLLFAWLAYLVTVGQPKFELSVFPATVRLHVLFALLAAGYIAYLAARRRLPGPTPLDLPIACLVLVYIFATLDSIYPRVSLEFALLAVAPILAYYAFHDFDFLSDETLLQGLMCVGAVAAIAALYETASDYVKWLDLIKSVGGGLQLFPPAVPRVHDVGGNVNILAMALNLSLPFALVFGLQTPSKREKALAAVLSLLILTALFFTISRGAWLGTIASFGVLGLLFLLRQHDPARLLAPMTRSPKRTAMFVVPPMLLGLLVVILVAANWSSRPDWLFRSSVSPRLDAMSVGIDIFKDRPWLGAGPGTYPLLYPTYSGKYPVENIHPHNGYISAMDDIGVIGALVVIAAAIVLGLSLLRAYRSADVTRRLTIAACIAALVSLIVHSLVDSPNTWNTALLPLAVVLALAVRLCGRLPSSTALLRMAPRVMLLVLLPVLFLAWYRLDGRQEQFHKAVADLRDARFDEAAEQSAVAATLDSNLAAAQVDAGVMRGVQYLVQADKRRTPDPVLLEIAKGYFWSAIFKDPRSNIANANLAVILQMQGESSGKDSYKSDAVDAANHALNLAQTDGTTAMVAGTVLEWAGHNEEAAYAFSRALIREPSLAQSPYWGAKPEREAIRKQALADDEISPCEWGRASAIYAGFEDDLNLLASRCRAEVDAKPGDPHLRAALAIILQALGRNDEARQVAEDAVKRVPDNPFVLTAMGIVRAASGDIDAGRQELAKAATLRDPYDPDAALLLAYTYDPPPSSTNHVLRNLHITPDPGPMPKPVRQSLETAYQHAAPFVFDDGRQRYALGILYYRVRFFRESPTSIIVPGDWLGLSSPRALLLEAALKDK